MTRLAATSPFSRVRASLKHQGRLVRGLGWWGWTTYGMAVRSRVLAGVLGHRIWAKYSRFPLTYRPGESDLAVLYQIFVAREYSCLDALSVRAGLIIDCGANVGYSAAYFLTQFPNARVVAIEPDPDSFRMLQLNTRRFGNRVEWINRGVWSHSCDLVFNTDQKRDGLSWTIQVREARPGETAQLAAVDIPAVLRKSQAQRIALLKVDVERAELAIFGPSSREWISRCDAIVIELHDEECERTFFSAIDGHNFRVSRFGDLTVCLREPGV